MRRREVIALPLGLAGVWPLAARAQKMPVIGFLCSQSQAQWARNFAAFREGLAESGYVEGRNFIMEQRWADSQFDRLPQLAAELVKRSVDLLVTSGGTVTAVAAKAATTIIPIVFVFGGDPVRSGLVTSLNRPGGNVTGVSFLLNALIGKRLELLRELAPGFTSIGLMANPKNPNFHIDDKDFRDAAQLLGIEVRVVTASTEAEIDAAFESLVRQRTPALSLQPDPLFVARPNQIVALAARHSMPAIYFARDFATAGGLMSYSTSFLEAHRQGGIQAARVLKGAKPAELPVVQPTKFELVVNVRVAKALGLTVPSTLLVAADEVIE